MNIRLMGNLNPYKKMTAQKQNNLNQQKNNISFKGNCCGGGLTNPYDGDTAEGLYWGTENEARRNSEVRDHSATHGSASADPYDDDTAEGLYWGTGNNEAGNRSISVKPDASRYSIPNMLIDPDAVKEKIEELKQKEKLKQAKGPKKS